MSRNKAVRQWEQDLIDAYYDYSYHQVLDPLYRYFVDEGQAEL
jgi:hypothetical protein